MTIYDVGDLVTLSTAVIDAAGTPTDATMALVVTKPDGTTVSPSITHGATGAYSATQSATAAGVWPYTWTASGTVEAVDAGQFTVADVAPPAYATLAQLKDNLSIIDTTDDEKLLRVLFTASRQIDEMCSRRFYLGPLAVRTYNPAGRIVCGSEGHRFLIDDIGSTAGLVVEIGTVGSADWTAVTDYETWPDNAIGRGRPIEALLRPLGWYLTALSRLRVTGRPGWPGWPDQVTEATLLQSGRIFRRRLSPDGLSGHGDFGQVPVGRVDPDVPRLLAPFMPVLVA